MPLVSIDGSGESYEVPAGANLLSAFDAAGVPVSHLCGGNALCGTCRVLVIHGGEHLPPRGLGEQHTLAKFAPDPRLRLSCQLAVRGDLRVVIQDAGSEAVADDEW